MIRQCLQCQKPFEITGKRHFLCGNRKLKTGCSYINKLKTSRDKSREYSDRSDVRFKDYRYSARVRNIPFDLTEEEFNKMWKKDCHYCGGRVSGIGIDRKDNSLGYVADNCVPCCRMCNMMKGKLTEGEFLQKCKDIIKNL